MKKSPADKCPTRFLALCLELCGATKFSVLVSLVSSFKNLLCKHKVLPVCGISVFYSSRRNFCTCVDLINFEYEHMFSSKLITEAKQAADLISVPELDLWIVFVLLEPGGAFLI